MELYCLFEKTKNKQKEAGVGPFFLKRTHQSDAGVDESDARDDREETDELVRVLFELEVDRSGEHDGADQTALHGAEAGPDDDG